MTEWSSRCEAALARRVRSRAAPCRGRRATTTCIASTPCCTAGDAAIDQVRAWALNRYFYQSMIPIKDATVLTRMEDPALRREWRQRIEDHDGAPRGRRRHRALAETDRRPRPRPRRGDLDARHPARRPASRWRPTSISAASRTLLEAIASSLTELFSPQIIGERIAGMLAHYDFVSKETLAYFTARPPQAPRDSDFALAYVKEHARRAGGPAGGDRCARVQVRRALGAARCALDTPMSSRLSAARRVAAREAADDAADRASHSTGPARRACRAASG